MTRSTSSPDTRLAILAEAFAARRDRLALELHSEPPRVRTARPIVTLQEHGYPIALGLASIALLPVLVRVLFGQRKLLFRLVMAVLHLRKMGRVVPTRRRLRRPS